MRLELAAQVRRATGFHLDVRLTIDAEALGVVGPSGSGKSTLLELVAGIEPGARVVLDGWDCSRLPVHRRGVGWVSQDALLFPHLSVRANLCFARHPAHSTSAAVSFDELVRALSIGPLLDRMPRHLSGGERRRVALGRAILARPRLLLLDEPFAGLDETRRRDAMSLLHHLRATYRIPILLVSHRAEEVVGLTDRIVRIEQGRVVAEGPSESMFGSGEIRIDNYLIGEVIGPGRVRVDEVELAVLLPPEAHGRVRLGCYAHELPLATKPIPDVSTRNVFPTRVQSLIHAGAVVLVTLAHPAGLRVVVTAEAAESLHLAAGAEVYALVKATALAYHGPA